MDLGSDLDLGHETRCGHETDGPESSGPVGPKIGDPDTLRTLRPGLPISGKIRSHRISGRSFLDWERGWYHRFLVRSVVEGTRLGSKDPGGGNEDGTNVRPTCGPVGSGRDSPEEVSRTEDVEGTRTAESEV